MKIQASRPQVPRPWPDLAQRRKKEVPTRRRQSLMPRFGSRRPASEM